jgi:hypothetical protein
MNRLKKEIRKKGIMLENDYLFLPCEKGGAILEGVNVDSNNCIITFFYTSIIVHAKLNRSGKFTYWSK